VSAKLSARAARALDEASKYAKASIMAIWYSAGIGVMLSREKGEEIMHSGF
jgi:hypothetical protein